MDEILRDIIKKADGNPPSPDVRAACVRALTEAKSIVEEAYGLDCDTVVRSAIQTSLTLYLLSTYVGEEESDKAPTPTPAVVPFDLVSHLRKVVTEQSVVSFCPHLSAVERTPAAGYWAGHCAAVGDHCRDLEAAMDTPGTHGHAGCIHYRMTAIQRALQPSTAPQRPQPKEEPA